MIRSITSMLAIATALLAADIAPAEAAPLPDTSTEGEARPADPVVAIVVTAKATRSATAIPQAEIQKILPGVSPLKRGDVGGLFPSPR